MLNLTGRRSLLLTLAAAAAAHQGPRASAATPALNFATAGSGVQWADVKIGSGIKPSIGQRCGCHTPCMYLPRFWLSGIEPHFGLGP
eukprot:6213436-Pleurochrysis_carterae.AAC.6